MEIRRYYFMEEQKLLRILKTESEQENSTMTEEERAEGEKAVQQRLNELYAHMEMEQKHCKRTIDIQKWEMF